MIFFRGFYHYLRVVKKITISDAKSTQSEIMQRIILFISLLVSPVLYAMPLMCPPASAFSHVEGRSWTISSEYSHQGWLVLPMAPEGSSLTKLNPESIATVELTSAQNTYSVECSYTASGSFMFTVVYNKPATGIFTKQDIANIMHDHQNFKWNMSGTECISTNGHLVSSCIW